MAGVDLDVPCMRRRGKGPGLRELHIGLSQSPAGGGAPAVVAVAATACGSRIMNIKLHSVAKYTVKDTGVCVLR